MTSEPIAISLPRIRKVGIAAICLGSLLLAGCALMQPSAPPSPPQPKMVKPNAPPVPDYSETVLDDGTRLTARTPEGEITIEAGPGLLRTLKWDGATRFVVTQPRKERYYGSKGIYFNGRPSNWETYNGLARVNYEEGQRHFDNLDDAKIWMQIRRLHYVHTSDGLVVGWRRRPAKQTLQVEVWQFYIDGAKPSSLPNAKNYQIRVQ